MLNRVHRIQNACFKTKRMLKRNFCDKMKKITKKMRF